MTYVPQFIAELVRAAKTVERLSVRQRRCLFGRAYMEIIELRTAASVFPSLRRLIGQFGFPGQLAGLKIFGTTR
jgi:hypothetical protein